MKTEGSCGHRLQITRSVSCVGAALILLGSGFLFAQGPKPTVRKPEAKTENTSSIPTSSTTHELTTDDVAAFLDGIMPQQLAREDIAGAVVSIVKDGKVVFAKGYGYSDVEKKTPVSPDGTLFRPGSISKLFTWTAVLQLVQEGKLDLDRDVNDYLDFKIPATFQKPITLRNIMTHTPGFEETVQNLIVSDQADMMPLVKYLREHMPARIFPPGTTPAYSNYATSVAGYIVQRVSGQDFYDYIEEHILKPLQMSHSTFRQPLPPSLAPMMSKGYEVASQKAKSYEYVVPAPAGSSAVTAMDMTHFMIAHLQNGQYEDVQILRPETAQMMHSRQFVNLPDMNGMCLGFYEETRNGHRIIGHGGDTEYFHSDLHLILDQQLGFFVSYNSAGKGEVSAREAVWHAFLDRYYPIQLPDPPAVATAAQDAQTVSGRYIVSRRSQTTLLKVLNVVGELRISANGDGTISANELKGFNGEPRKFREIAPMMFRDVNDQDLLGFKRDDAGNLVAVIDFPFMVFQRSSAWDNSGLQLPIICVSLGIVVLTVLLWPVMALARRHYKHPLELTSGQRRLRLFVRLGCVAFIVFFAGFVIFFTMGLKDMELLTPKGNIWLRLIQIFGWLGVLGTLLAVYGAIRSWQNSATWVWAKIGNALIALSCLGIVAFIFTWNLLVLSLRY
jgi:CubicO group peptidase (beta-lactamase class C family)